jgi:hypothetical protein
MLKESNVPDDDQGNPCLRHDAEWFCACRNCYRINPLYLYKEGAREISAQIDNKDEMPYLIKSWVEAPEGKRQPS